MAKQRKRNVCQLHIIACIGLIVLALKLQLPTSEARVDASNGFSYFGKTKGKETPLASSILSSTPSPLSLSTTTQLLIDLRGGAQKKTKQKARTASLSSSSQAKTATGKKKVGAKAAAEKEKKSSLADSFQKYKKILPLTRIYITLVGIATLAGIILGEELTFAILALDPMRVLYGFEMWRPITAATFLGTPSIGWLMSGYYLFEYGSSLERAYGSAQHLVFLLSQITILSIFSALFGQPFFAQSMITAMLHVLSRAMPNQKIKWLVFTVPYWSLPYGLMATDVLQAQSPMAALPHIMGIISGHFYQFHKFVWPKMGGEDWLVPPDFIHRRLDPDAREQAQKSMLSSKLKSRNKKKGRKLGG